MSENDRIKQLRTVASSIEQAIISLKEMRNLIEAETSRVYDITQTVSELRNHADKGRKLAGSIEIECEVSHLTGFKKGNSFAMEKA